MHPIHSRCVVHHTLIFDPFLTTQVPGLITVGYLSAVYFGTQYMKDKEPFTGDGIKRVSLIHNFILFTLSLYMVIETLLAS